MRELLAFLPYVLRTTLRARARSLLTLLGAALAMTLFAFVRTVDAGTTALAERSAQPVPGVTGHTLRTLGLPPGPEYARILGKIREAWLEWAFIIIKRMTSIAMLSAVFTEPVP